MSKHALAIIFAISASLAVPAARAAASDYIPLEYIYMEGGAAYGQSAATHFIDTGVVPSSNWTITASFASTNTTGAAGVYSVLFCARQAGTADSLVFWPHIGSSGAEGYARIDIAGNNRNSGQWKNDMQRNAISQCVKHTVEIKPSTSGMSAGYFDGINITDGFKQSGSSVCPLYLFSAYTGASDGSVSAVKFSFEGWFYGLQASDGDGVIRLDLVPAVRASDGVVGVYDAANGNFYTNGNANYSFVAGPAAGGLGIASVSKVSGAYVPVVTNGFAGVATAGTDYIFAVTSDAAGAKTMAVTGAGTYAGCQDSARFQTLLDPAEYIELDGISMTGASWIAPEIGGNPVVPRGDWTIEMGYVLGGKTLDNASYSCIFSARMDNSTTGNAILFWNSTNPNKDANRLGRFDYQGNVNLPGTGNSSNQGYGTYKGNDETPMVMADIPLATAYGVEHVFKIEGGVQSLDGGTVYDASIGGSGDYSSSCGTNFVCGGSLVLFTSSTNGVPSTIHAAAGTFKYLAMSEATGELISAMIPAKRVTDGVAGVYDVVNRTFYQSATATAFAAGTEALIPEQSSGLLIFVR